MYKPGSKIIYIYMGIFQMLLTLQDTSIWPPEYRSFFEHLETGVKTTSKHV